MSNAAITKIERLYDAKQRRFRVKPGSPELAAATNFYTNRSRPVHRWFHFKEGFAADLLNVAGIDTTPLLDEDAVFLDPFCGSGTTLLSGDIQYKWRARKIGLEINPFLSFVARTKINWRQYDPRRLSRLVEEVLAEPLQDHIARDKWPSLSTLHNSEIFSPRRVSALLDVVGRIRSVAAPESDLLLLGIAAAAERLGFYRKDGRALRILRSPNALRQRKWVRIKNVLKDIWTTYEIDLRVIQEQRELVTSQSTVLRADGRTIVLPEDLQVGSGQVALIAYSPPYLNHIDYTEVYKVELWLLGFVTEQQEMLNLRKQTLRSHASTTFTADGLSLPPSVTNVVDLAASAIEASGKEWHQRFRDTAFGYLQDIHESLSHQYELLRPGGQVVCVVANSAHGSKSNRIPIAIDLFIASIGRNLGFEIQQLLVARQMRRRDSLNRYLRETVIIMRRPVST